MQLIIIWMVGKAYIVARATPSSLAHLEMRASLVAVILGCVGLSWASPASTMRRVVHEKRDFLSPRWTRTQKVDPGLVLPMRFGCV